MVHRFVSGRNQIPPYPKGLPRDADGFRCALPEYGLSVIEHAVKTTTDPDDPQEVATVDDSKKAILKDIFLADERNIFPHREQD